MFREIEMHAQRAGVFVTQVLEPAIFPRSVPLSVAAFQCSDPISVTDALRREYRPVSIGWRWGPVWSTAWFKLTGRVPAEMAGRPVVLRFSSGTEALLWRDGVPAHGFDPYHRTAPLFDPARGDEPVELYVEAACNRPLGVTMFWWDTPDAKERWASADPGQLTSCDLATYDAGVWRLARAFDFTRQFLLLLPEDSLRARQLCDALQQAMEAVDASAPSQTAPAACEILAAALRGQPSSRTRCLAVGQGHLDTAWLWRIRETRRKALRTFATALALMDADPTFRLLWSQAQQYAWTQQDSPELFARIKQRVQSGQWEAGGAMWVEPDCNVPSGESLVRQILHGSRYWERTFGERGKQSFLYLPDTFGFSGAIPQIMALAGLDTFITNKLTWNDTNEFPYTNFRWRGIDGTEVLGHCTPGRDYNAVLSPQELQRAEHEVARKDAVRAGVWLQPYGYGDGGGGPTAEMLEGARLAHECEGLPAVTLASARTFCDELRQARETLQRQGRDLPTWDGELYLEYHRGTYTTQAWLKRANRQAEQALRIAEWLTWAGPAAPDAAHATRARGQFDEAWKTLLLNQFHDILPGSSITEVYVDARQDHHRVRESCAGLINDGLRTWAQDMDTQGLSAPLAVFNPCSMPRSGIVECAGERHYVADIPALGMAVVDRARPTAVAPVQIEGSTLSNGIISATIDEWGRVVGLRRAGSRRDACCVNPDGTHTPLNQLVLYDDRPRHWDAWDLDAEYEFSPSPIEGPPQTWRVAETSALRAVIEVTRPLGRASRITQRFILEAGAPRLDIQTQVDWHEEHRFLRALFPVDVRSSRATYEIQFGHIERSTQRSTSLERARFEVCAHRWMDLSEPGFGVALLNDCKYGHSCHDGVLGLSLLRSPKFPDPQADMGTHEFTYSLMVHDGDWRAAGVDRQAEALNMPFLAVPLAGGHRGMISSPWPPFSIAVDGSASVVVSAVKLAEDDERLILRLAETHGGRGRATIQWHLPVSAVEPVDLLEHPMPLATYCHDAEKRRSGFELRPFQIVTLAASRMSGPLR